MTTSLFVSWDEFLEIGRSHRAANPGMVEQIMEQATGDDVITLVYTSGTTGPPKGAMLTNSNFAFNAGSLDLGGESDSWTESRSVPTT